MSRAKAKLCKIKDLQGRLPDIILTKKDCDMICKSLETTYPFDEIADLYYYFKKLGYEHLVKCRNLL
jgi:hypothetical protein